MEKFKELLTDERVTIRYKEAQCGVLGVRERPRGGTSSEGVQVSAEKVWFIPVPSGEVDGLSQTGAGRRPR